MIIQLDWLLLHDHPTRLVVGLNGVNYKKQGAAARAFPQFVFWSKKHIFIQNLGIAGASCLRRFFMPQKTRSKVFP